MKFVPVLLFIFADAVPCQSVYDLCGTDKFRRAYFASDTKEITFEPFQQLNWEAKARTSLPWLNLDRPTPPQIARLSPFESAGPQFRSVDFRAPLDPAVGHATYLLIHAAGIIPIEPVRLKGSVDFDFNTSMTAVERKVVSGTIVGKPSRPVTSAGFAIVGKPADVTDVRTGAKFERRRQAGPAVYDFSHGGRTVTWTTSSTEQPDATSAFSFQLAGQHLLLVKWDSDFCGSVYTLFSVGAALQPVAGNDYECDP